MLKNININKELDCLVIVGPTAVGKSKFAIELAQKYDGEIISGDAYQVYKKMDIGTAKVSTEEMQGIKHYLIDICDYKDEFNVKIFQAKAREIIQDIKSRGKLPIIVGGTGLYIQAVLFEYEFDENIEFKNMKQELEVKNLLELQQIVKRFNIELNNSDWNNHRRLVNVAAKLLLNIELNNNGTKRYYENFEVIGLTMSREIIYDRINKRVDEMIEKGLIEEVVQFEPNYISQLAIGYKEIHQYLNNEIGYEETIELIKKNSRNFAKRQYTWFKNKMDITWIEIDSN